MPTVLTATDFPRWTRAALGLPIDANVSEEVDLHILHAEDHVRSIIGDDAFAQLADDGEANADRYRRFRTALHSLVESRLHNLQAETLGKQAGSSTQGRRSRTISGSAAQSSRNASTRSYRDYVERMFALGVTVRAPAMGIHYTRIRP